MNSQPGLAVVDSGGANIASVMIALRRLGVDARLTTDADVIGGARRVLLPGVGAAGPVMRRLRGHGLVDVIRGLRSPLLGICVGMQVLYERSEEGDVEGLGLLEGEVRRLPASPGARVPHMGWNTLSARHDSPLLAGIEPGARGYFVHSYAAKVDEACVASTTHGMPIAAVVQRGNVAGAQFHPERSATTGAQLLRNFMAWGPS